LKIVVPKETIIGFTLRLSDLDIKSVRFFRNGPISHSKVFLGHNRPLFAMKMLIGEMEREIGRQ
jgi:hypothetical protein